MTYDSIKARQAQKKYCEEHNLPHFAPESGVCWRCGNNIYYGQRGISVEEAGSTLITGCPHCHWSYCE